MSGGFDLPRGRCDGIRRLADLSQRELARRAAASKSAVAARRGRARRGLTADASLRAAALAGLRLALVDAAGTEVTAMAGDAVRDLGGRRFPAHLDTRYGDEGWWHGPAALQQAAALVHVRPATARAGTGTAAATGTPDDHQLPQPGDSPQERAAGAATRASGSASRGTASARS